MSRETPQIWRECYVLPQTSIVTSTQKRAPENVRFSVNTALDSCTKAAHLIAAVEILVNNILHHGMQEAVLPPNPALEFLEKLPKIMKNHPVEDGALRMSEKLDPCHSRSHRSKNGVTSWLLSPSPEKTAMPLAQKSESGRESVDRS